MTRILGTLLMLFALAATSSAADKEARIYELRTYYAPEGRLDDLHARFRQHTLKLFEKHGMTNVGYWVPLENPDRKLIYVLSYPSREARDASWKAFQADPAWQAVRKETEAKGPIVAKVESVLMQTTDYSPQLSTSAGESGGVLELRVYTTTPGNLEALNARFRNHTVKLFEKHGMTNVIYWTPLEGQKGAENTLIYLLAHRSVDAAKASFDAFRRDPDWLAARKASEEKAGGSLTVENGVQSTFLKPTDYSPRK